MLFVGLVLGITLYWLITGNEDYDRVAYFIAVVMWVVCEVVLFFVLRLIWAKLRIVRLIEEGHGTATVAYTKPDGSTVKLDLDPTQESSIETFLSALRAEREQVRGA